MQKTELRWGILQNNTSVEYMTNSTTKEAKSGKSLVLDIGLILCLREGL